MKSFASRNIKIYFRDRAAVLFSLLGVFIVVALYTVFLGDNLASGFSQISDPKLLVACWLVAGICAITPVTTSMGAMGALVDDRAKGISKDFLASPTQRARLVGGYLAGGLVAATAMSAVVMLLGGAYLAANGLALPDVPTLLAIVGVQLLSVISGTSMMFFLVSFFSTLSAFSAASTVVGTVIGFLTGIYLPIGLLPEAVQWGVRVFPTSHAASLLRYLLLQGPAADIFKGVPQNAVDDVWKMLGVRLWFTNEPFPLWGSVLYLAGFALLFFVLSVVNFSRKRK